MIHQDSKLCHKQKGLLFPEMPSCPRVHSTKNLDSGDFPKRSGCSPLCQTWGSDMTSKHPHLPWTFFNTVDPVSLTFCAFLWNKFMYLQVILFWVVNKFQLLNQWFSNFVLGVETFFHPKWLGNQIYRRSKGNWYLEAGLWMYGFLLPKPLSSPQSLNGSWGSFAEPPGERYPFNYYCIRVKMLF